MSTTPASGDVAAPRPRRGLSLRSRLIALVLVVAAAALVAVDVVIPLTTRSALLASKDQTLTSVVNSLPPSFGLDMLENLGAQNPLAGEVGWSRISTAGVAQVVFDPPGQRSANPSLGARPSTAAPFTVPDTSGDGVNYRVLASTVTDSFTHRPAGYIVAWISLADVQHTLSRLVLLEVLISLGLLVLVGGIAGLVIRRELRPLETMARTADQIAGGDLARRVDPGPPGTEIGRLGVAFNGMVDGVSELLAERAESERRMRQFVADASHELRTPVAAIRGYTDLYRAGALPEDLALDRAMDRMGFESRRMGALVEDLLTLTHTDAETAAPTDPVDLVPLLTGVVDDAAVIDRSRTWRLAGTATRAVVPGDRLRLHQLFANLLANVRTHTPAATTATVSVTATGDAVTVSVIDDGPGVSDEYLPRLFDRFFRVDASRSRERGGSGLGLSIAAAIVRTHRGRIVASRTPGGGLTVTVELPAAPPAPPGPDAAGAGVPAAPSGSPPPGSVPPRSVPPPGSPSPPSALPVPPGSSPPGASSPPSPPQAPPDGPRPLPPADAPTGMPGAGARSR